MTTSESKRAAKKFNATCQGHLRAVSTPGSTALRSREIEAARTFEKNQRAQLERELAGAKIEYRDKRHAWNGAEEDADPAPSSESFTYQLGKAAFLALEIPLGALVGMYVFNFSSAVAAGFGVLVTFSLYFATRVFLQVLIADGEGKPQTKFRLIQKIFAMLFGVWVTAMVMALLIARVASREIPYMDVIYAVLLTLLTLVSPASAAALGLAKEIRGWGNRAAVRWMALKRQIQALDELRAASDEAERAIPRLVDHAAA